MISFFLDRIFRIFFILLILLILSENFQAFFCFGVDLSAGQAIQIVGQTFSALAHPAGPSSGVAQHKGMVQNIVGDHSACADKAVFPYGGATDDGAVGAEGDAVFNQGGTYLIHLPNFGPGIVDIGKHHGRAAKNTVFQGDAFVNGDIVLDLTPFADGHIRTDHHVLADIAFFTNVRIG